MSKLTLTEQVEEAARDQFELVKLIVQLAVLEEKVKPLLPPASKKLVSDLLGSGCSPKRLGAVIGRAPSYIVAVGSGDKSLSARDFTRLVRHAMSSGANNASR